VARTVYYAAMSLDGYIAEPEEKLEWLTKFDGPGTELAGAGPVGDGYAEFMKGIGSLAMGPKTYEFIAGEASWPYGDMPTWVYTRRERPALEGAANLTFAAGDVSDLHGELLAAAGERDLWVIGGGDLASQYVAAGLLDLVRVTVVPIILGAGLPLFAEPLPRPMKLLGTTPFETGMVELSYEVVR